MMDQARRGVLPAFEILMRRYDQDLYRAVRSVLRDGEEVEDVMRETYLVAFRSLHRFARYAKFSTWLLEIGVAEALERLGREVTAVGKPSARTPNDQIASREAVGMVEAALDRMPGFDRQVFTLHIVNSLDTADVARVLGIGEDMVEHRLCSAQAMLQDELEEHLDRSVRASFRLLGARSDRIVASVMLQMARSWKEGGRMQT